MVGQHGADGITLAGRCCPRAIAVSTTPSRLQHGHWGPTIPAVPPVLLDPGHSPALAKSISSSEKNGSDRSSVQWLLRGLMRSQDSESPTQGTLVLGLLSLHLPPQGVVGGKGVSHGSGELRWLLGLRLTHRGGCWPHLRVRSLGALQEGLISLCLSHPWGLRNKDRPE